MSRKAARIDVLGELRRPEETPDLVLPVVAVAGRSNVGKSSLLNALLGRHRLLRTSRTPGCTRTIQLISVESRDGSFVVADLPGYGYAALSKGRRDMWGPLIEGFLRRTTRLAAVLMLIDARRGPEQEEQDLLDFLDGIGAEAIVVLTKCDKLQRSKAATAVERMRARVRGVAIYPTAATTEEGLDALWRVVIRKLRGRNGTGKGPAGATTTTSTSAARSPEPRASASGQDRAAGSGAGTGAGTGREDMAGDPQREKFQQARSAATAGRLDEAIGLCHTILSGDPRHRGALDLLGFAHFFKKEFAVAEQWCRKTLDLYPEHAYAHKGLGLCLARQGKLDDGLPHLREAMRLEPKFFDPYWDTAVVLRDAGRYAEALEVLRHGLSQCPERMGRARGLLDDLETRAGNG
jgi:GTP-binding protein